MSDETPIVSGPSFLGLNRPDPRSRASMTIDPHGSSSGPRNLDYLLDDEDEEEHHGGAGKFIVILLALALAAGLGYLRWRNQGFGWLGALSSKRPATAQTTDGNDATSSSAPSSGDSSITPAPAAPAPASPNGTVAQPPPSAAPPVASGNPPTPAPAAAPNNPPAAGDASSATTTNNSATATPVAPPAAAPSPAAKDDGPSADDSSADQPKAAPAPKPRPAPQPTADSTIDLAKEFIYGTNGVRQDCDRGLKLLKPAAAASNPRAMTELGALYSAGLCTPRDLPTAYRWFALALRKQPDNQAVQNDLQKLWGEMTQPERQLAIKLSQ